MPLGPVQAAPRLPHAIVPQSRLDDQLQSRLTGERSVRRSAGGVARWPRPILGKVTWLFGISGGYTFPPRPLHSCGRALGIPW